MLHNITIMRTALVFIILVFILLIPACKQSQKPVETLKNLEDFPRELVVFAPYDHNPVFVGTKTETWDKSIRERGFILFDDGIYKMWYTGYKGNDNDIKYLGYATSNDGITWDRYQKDPVFREKWTEDMSVTPYEGKYYMYAEGENDIAHLLTSDDGIYWQEQGDLIMLTTKGDTIPGPYGTPSLWIENGKWYLFYERNDEAIWLAVSNDKKTWRNIQDEPVLKKGPEIYDSGAVATNQIIKFREKYYMYYHATTDSGWNVPGNTSLWTSNVAMSVDLLHWVKYPDNPIVEGDHSSPILVPDGNKFRLYTMHSEVCLYYSE